MGEDVSNGYKAFLIISTLVVCLAFGIPALVIGVDYNNNPQKLLDTNGTFCGLSSSPPLPVWNIVYGAMAISSGVCLSLAVLVINSSKGPFVAASILFGCFNLAWNIVGAVALFRDSSCAAVVAYPLWAITLACLIITWINMFFTCITGSKAK